MKLIVILASLFAVVAVAHAYSTNMLEALLQIIDNTELEQDKPSMEIQGQYKEVRTIVYVYTVKIMARYTVESPTIMHLPRAMDFFKNVYCIYMQCMTIIEVYN